MLVVEDDRNLREALVDTLQIGGFSVVEASSGESALRLLADQDVGMVLTDYQLGGMNGQTLLERVRERFPRTPVLLMTAFGTVEGAVRAIQAGAHDYLTKPFDPDTLLRHVARLLGQLGETAEESLVAKAPATRAVLELADRVAGADVTVMLSGESGTGKEVFARFIHSRSRRRKGPFIAINCAAIPEQMLEATLFGYEKGAFTGAVKAMPGKFEQAVGGTLLLDEVSEMQPGLQAKLLRVLQEREVERLGSQKTLSLDLRVLATSNRDMVEEVAAGRFREDLFYRLNVFGLRLPPLRERREDIFPLAQKLMGRICADTGRPVPVITEDAEETLLAHDWPGNIRELENAIQRALVMAIGREIKAEHFALEPTTSAYAAESRSDADKEAPTADLRAHEEKAIIETLRAACGNRSEAARRLGISPRTLRYKVARMRSAGVAIPGEPNSFEERS